jgi:tetratricopeptide (TPR) repeat protein
MNRKKNSKTIAIFSNIAIILLLLGMFVPAATYAETPKKQYDNVREQYQQNNSSVQDFQDFYQESRKEYQDAKEQFKNARTGKNSDGLKKATMNFLNHTIDYMIGHLDEFKIKAEVAEENGVAPFEYTDNIEDYTEQFEHLKDDITTAGTREDFQSTVREIRDIWQHVYLEFRYFVLGTMHNRVDILLDRSNSISDRIGEEIDRLNDAGVETSKLERLLTDYSEDLNDAKESHKKADELFDNHEGFNDEGVLEDEKQAKKFLNEADKNIRQTHQILKHANSKLRTIFFELKQHRPGSVDLNGTGRLTASGDGQATLSGDLEIEVSAKSATLTIIDHGADVDLVVSGEGTKEVVDDGAITYSGFNGTATVSGSSISVVINGDDIQLTAYGTGSAVLRGFGTYTVETDDGQTTENDWAPNRGEVA